MTPRELIDTAIVPGGGEALRLFQRGGDFTIALDRDELMSSPMSGSEEALAVMTCERLDSAKPHLLIGGYGMGFTLRAAQAALGGKARLKVESWCPRSSMGGARWPHDPRDAWTIRGWRSCSTMSRG